MELKPGWERVPGDEPQYRNIETDEVLGQRMYDAYDIMQTAGACPFCGGTPEINDDGEDYGAWVGCTDCQMAGPWEETIAAAVQGWNTRVPDDSGATVEERPCPFCGGEVDIHEGESPEEGKEGFWVQCSKCSTEGPILETESEVLAIWNRRTHQPSLL